MNETGFPGDLKDIIIGKLLMQPLDFKYFFKEFIEKFFVHGTEMKRVTLILPVFFFVCENCVRTIAVRGHRNGGAEAYKNLKEASE